MQYIRMLIKLKYFVCTMLTGTNTAQHLRSLSCVIVQQSFRLWIPCGYFHSGSLFFLHRSLSPILSGCLGQYLLVQYTYSAHSKLLKCRMPCITLCILILRSGNTLFVWEFSSNSAFCTCSNSEFATLLNV